MLFVLGGQLFFFWVTIDCCCHGALALFMYQYHGCLCCNSCSLFLCLSTRLIALSSLPPTSPEIEKVQKDEGKEEEKFIDVVINKNMKLGQKVLIPVKQFPKVSATVFPPPEKTWSAQTVGEF